MAEMGESSRPNGIESSQESNGGIEDAAPNGIESSQESNGGIEDVAPNGIESSQESNGGIEDAAPNGIESSQESNGGIEDAAPNGIESSQESNGGNSGFRGVNCGGNTALHVVAGVMEKSSSTETFLEFMMMMNSNNSFRIDNVISYNPAVREGTRNAQSRKKKMHDSVIHKDTTYVEIAKIIYHLNRTLLTACNKLTGEIPLHCAVKSGKLEMVSLLVQFAQDEGPQTLEKVLRAPNKVGETALHEAARSGYSDVVEELLRADENLASVEDDNGISPLYLAVAAGFLDVVEQLIAPNHQPSYGGPDEQTALHAIFRKVFILRSLNREQFGSDAHRTQIWVQWAP